MAERSVVMTGGSVPAILDRRKTQTRRALTRTAFTVDGKQWSKQMWAELTFAAAVLRRPGTRQDGLQVPRDWEGCVGGVWRSFHRLRPRWEVGDRLWVREVWANSEPPDPSVKVHYQADWPEHEHGPRWRSPRFMPKWAARLWLAVTALRFERLQDISLEDCYAEGVQIPVTEDHHALIELTSKYPASRYLRHLKGKLFTEEELTRAYFASGWDERNAKRGFGWEKNPWVLVATFKLAEVKEGVPVPS